MVPVTEATIRKVRRFLNETVPTGGTAADTAFSEEDISDLLEDAANIYAAAALGWRWKAAGASAGAGELTKYTIGQETYERSSGGDYADYCLEMAKMYDELAAKADAMESSRVLTLRRPKVV